MRALITATILLTLLGLTNMAQAYQGRQITETLNYHHNHYTPSGTLFLKGKLTSQKGYSYNELEDYHLKSVVIYAKSRAGRGVATLEIDGDRQDRVTVERGKRLNHDRNDNDGRFENDRPRSYKSFDLYNYEEDDYGNWRVELDGSIKVLKVTVIMERRRRFGRDRVVEIGEERVPKFVTVNHQFRLNERRVSEIILQSTRGTVIIKEAYAENEYGNLFRLYNLEGSLRNGQEAYEEVERGSRIRKIHISATSGLSGSRGQYKLSVKAPRRRR